MPDPPDHLRPCTGRPDLGYYFGYYVGAAACIIMALASVVDAVDAPLSLLAALFFGGVAWLLIHEDRTDTGRAYDRLRPFRVHVARHDPDGLRHLLRAVAGLRGRQRVVALEQIGQCARLFDGLVFHARRHELDIPATTREPLSAALASLHADGHVREAAVVAMAARPLPGHLPFLLERAVDWVAPIRVRALAALTGMLATDPESRRRIADLFARIAAREHASAVAALIASAEPGWSRCCGVRIEPCPYVIRERRR